MHLLSKIEDEKASQLKEFDIQEAEEWDKHHEEAKETLRITKTKLSKT